MTLTFAGTALANDLHQDTPIVGTEFENTEMGCDEGWHFIHTDTDGSDLPAELTAEFADAGTVKVDGYSNGNGNGVVMYDVHVSADDTLLSASDDISNEGLLNLSHVCVDQTTTTTTTTTAPETTTTTTTAPETTTTTTTTAPETTTTTTDVVTTTTANETTPEGSVEELTPPSTDTIGQPTSSSSVSTGLLLVLAGILAAVLVVVPAAARNRR